MWFIIQGSKKIVHRNRIITQLTQTKQVLFLKLVLARRQWKIGQSNNSCCEKYLNYTLRVLSTCQLCQLWKIFELDLESFVNLGSASASFVSLFLCCQFSLFLLCLQRHPLLVASIHCTDWQGGTKKEEEEEGQQQKAKAKAKAKAKRRRGAKVKDFFENKLYTVV